MLAIVIVEGLAIALLAVLVLGLLRSHAEILYRLHQLGAGVADDGGEVGRPRGVTAPVRLKGAVAHDLAGVTVEDEAVALAVTGVAHDTVIAFLSSGCSTCAGFWSAFGEPGLTVPGSARLVAVSKESDQESPTSLRELAPTRIPLVLSNLAWEDYQVPGSPYFVYVDGRSGRVVGEGTGGSWAQVASLLAQAVSDQRDAAHREDGKGVDRVADELAAAGIRPGDASLYGPMRQAGRK